MQFAILLFNNLLLVVEDNNVHEGQQNIFLISFFIQKLIHQNTVNDSINITTLFDVYTNQHRLLSVGKVELFVFILNLCHMLLYSICK